MTSPRAQEQVLGLVPVRHDDGDAPHGCAALRELDRRALVRWAVDLLARSGRVTHVLVPGPALVREAIQQALSGVSGPIDLEVLPVEEQTLAGVLLTALQVAGPAPGATVLVHDPLQALTPAQLVAAVLDALSADPQVAAAVPVVAVTDTLKWVEDDVLTGTADREAFRTVLSPHAYRAAELLRALRALPAATGPQAPGPQAPGPQGIAWLPGVVAAVGGRLCTVPGAGAPFEIATAQDLVLAQAVRDLSTAEGV